MDQGSPNRSVVVIESELSEQGWADFNRAVWKRYAEIHDPYMFPIIDPLWYSSSDALDDKFTDLEWIGVTGERAEEFYEQYYLELEAYTLFALKKMRIVHGVPLQQSMFLSNDAAVPLLYAIFPQLEVW